MPARTICPKPFSKRRCRAKYLLMRSNLRALMVHLRAQGHRVRIRKTDRFHLLGVEDESGSLYLCSNTEAAHQATRRAKKPSKTLYPWFGMWQEKRLVLLKGNAKSERGLRAQR